MTTRKPQTQELNSTNQAKYISPQPYSGNRWERRWHLFVVEGIFHGTLVGSWNPTFRYPSTLRRIHDFHVESFSIIVVIPVKCS